MRDDLLAPGSLARMLVSARMGPRRRVPVERLWAAYRAVYGGFAEGVQAREELAAVLDALQANGSCRLPSLKGKGWDRTSRVALPKWIELSGSAPERDTGWREFPWRPELAWVAQLPAPTREQLDLLRAVQRGLVEGWFAVRAPLKYRSLQLTGDEKRLEACLGSRLFAEGRLTLETLNCDGPWLPLARERVGDNRRLIVFENAGSFLVAWRVLRSLPTPPYGMVAYGGGFQVLRAIPYMAQMARIEAIRYVGDLDVEGVSIAADFARKAAEAGLPAPAPATQVHLAMLKAAAGLDRPGGWPAPGKSRPVGDVSWLAEVADRVGKMLAKGNRIPEEVLHDGHFRGLWG